MGNLEDPMEIYSSIAREAQPASASTATRVTLRSPWLSRDRDVLLVPRRYHPVVSYGYESYSSSLGRS